ncbi:hypothetical protein ACWCRI_38500, partial [Streptomyces collinus]
MPYSPPPRALSGPRRRSLIASAAGAALLVGCSAAPDSGDAGPSRAARARARAARDSASLLERVECEDERQKVGGVEVVVDQRLVLGIGNG